jgi:protein involved in polysaccharide export with SLBB domain
MQHIIAGVLTLLCLLTAAPLAAQEAPAGGGGEMITLRPGDAVRVNIWREPDLSGEFNVDPTGRITFPLLGDMNVAEMPVSVLRDTLISQYRRQLRNPSITITPLKRINVIGEVQRPGLYAMDPTISLAGAVAMAGGATPLGNLERIVVLRAGETVPQRVSSLMTLDRVQLRSGDQIIVQRRSWFDRNSSVVVSMVLSVTSVIVTLIK